MFSSFHFVSSRPPPPPLLRRLLGCCCCGSLSLFSVPLPPLPDDDRKIAQFNFCFIVAAVLPMYVFRKSAQVNKSASIFRFVSLFVRHEFLLVFFTKTNCIMNSICSSLLLFIILSSFVSGPLSLTAQPFSSDFTGRRRRAKLKLFHRVMAI